MSSGTLHALLHRHLRRIVDLPQYSTLTPSQKREVLRALSLELHHEEMRSVANIIQRIDMRGV